MSTEAKMDLRDELRTVPQDDFLKAHTRSQMDEFATELGLDPKESANKGELYQALVDASDLPDPSLRERSSVESPVARMWQFCDETIGPKIAAGEQRPRRKDTIADAREAGIAYHTARTQYQSWATATNYGERRLADLDRVEVPVKIRDELYGKEESED